LPAYTIDASVIVNAFNDGEVGHDESLAFFTAARRAGATIVAPSLLLPEVAGAVARGRQDVALARSLTRDLAELSALTLVSVDRAIATDAAELATKNRLRGADAVYGAVALRFNAILVTHDREQRDRLEDVLTMRSPEEALTEMRP
jgi:predicted nucleic acid-binding protein